MKPTLRLSLPLLVLLAACSGGGGGGGGSNPAEETEENALLAVSPGPGEFDVLWSRQLRLTFGKALDRGTVTSEAIRVDSLAGGPAEDLEPVLDQNGRTIRIQFSQEPLPAGDIVTVTVDGDLLTDTDGEPVDADRDGEPGGVRTWRFYTLPLLEVEGTALAGRVVAAEPGPDGEDLPLAEVNLQVMGQTQINATTDENGEFLLEEVPVGTFFVRLKGNKVTGVEEGIQYAEAERPFTSVAGQTTDVGTLYLSVVHTDSFAVPRDDEIPLAPEQLDAWSAEPALRSAFSQIRLLAPKNGMIFEDDGSAGGKVAVAAAPAGRLPVEVPGVLDAPLVVAVEPSGRHHFQEPFGLVLPNLATPSGGVATAAAGAGLWYFDPELGRFDLAGPMTVSGGTLRTEAGVGLPGPGYAVASTAVALTLGPPPEGDADAEWQKLLDAGLSAVHPDGGLLTRAVWRLEVGGETLRGRVGRSGELSVPAPPKSAFEFELYHPRFLAHVRASGETPRAGTRATIGPLVVEALDPAAADGDADGLPDAVEGIAGTDPAKRDTDGDGLGDGVELDLGLDPLTADAPSGALAASVPVAGVPRDVAVGDGWLACAVGGEPIELFGLGRALQPFSLGSVETEGGSFRLAIDGGRLAVADSGAGLLVVDLGAAAGPEVLHDLKFDSAAMCVATSNGLAFVGLQDGLVAAVELASGTVLGQVRVEEDPDADPAVVDKAVRDLAVSGEHLYALTEGRVWSLEIRQGLLRLVGDAPAPTASEDGNTRLSAGSRLLVATHANGVNLFSLEDPGAPAPVEDEGLLFEAGWRQAVALADDALASLVGEVSPTEAPIDLRLYGLAPTKDGLALEFADDLQVPGRPEAMRIAGGTSYVASRATAGVDPAVHLLRLPELGGDGASSLELLASSEGDSVQEGSVLCLSAEGAVAGGPVAYVDFLVDGVPVGRDETFPFEHRRSIPLASELSSFRVRARAVGVGGASVASEEREFTVVEDDTPPVVLDSVPSDGGTLPEGTETKVLAVLFSEPMQLESFDSTSVLVRSSGPDFQTGTADDLEVLPASFSTDPTGQTLLVRFEEPLPADRYRLRVEQGALDLKGNPLAEAYQASFTLPGEDSDGDGLFDDFETGVSGTDPNDSDTDGDGLGDGVEIVQHGTDPLDDDSDDDGILDGVEIQFALDPLATNPSTRVRGRVTFDGAAVQGALAHMEDAAVVSNPLLSFLQETNPGGEFEFASAWPVDGNPIRVEVQRQTTELGLLYGFSGAFSAVTGGTTDVGTIALQPVDGTRGLDFASAFLPNVGLPGYEETLEVTIVAAEDTTAVVTFPERGVTDTLFVAAGSAASTSVLGDLDGLPEPVHVTADRAATVHLRNLASPTDVLSELPGSADALTAIPRSALGRSYRVVSYETLEDESFPQLSQFAVVAAVNGTRVSVTPSVDTETHLAGEVVEVVLDRLEVFSMRAPAGDLTGTLVSADKRISVVGGNPCAVVTLEESCEACGCGHLAEQLLPNNALSTQFPFLATDGPGGDVLRLVGGDHAQPAQVTIEGPAGPVGDPLLVHAGSFVDVELDGLAWIESTQKISVAQLVRSDSGYEPAMMVVPGTGNLRRSYEFELPSGDFQSHYLNLALAVGPGAGADPPLPLGDLATATLDGIPLDDVLISAQVVGGCGEVCYEQLGDSGFIGLRLKLFGLEGGFHTLTSDVPMAAFAYGFSDQESYAFPVGF